MLPSIAPLGVSETALDVLRQALDLALAIKRQARARDSAEPADPVHLGLLSAARKLASPDLEELEKASEREGLLKLLTLAEDMAREDTRVRGVRLAGLDRPDIEIADLRRRARNAVPVDVEQDPLKTTSHQSAAWKEAS
jgi:hypothetical protein